MFKVPNFDRNSAHKDLFARFLDPQLICSSPTGHRFFTSQFQICPWDYFSVERKSTRSGDSATCSGYYNCKYIAIVLLLCQKKTKKKDDEHNEQMTQILISLPLFSRIIPLFSRIIFSYQQLFFLGSICLFLKTFSCI